MKFFSFGTIRFAGGQHNGYILKIDSNLEYQDHSIHQLGFHTHFLSALYSSQYNSFYVLAPVRPDSVNLNNLMTIRKDARPQIGCGLPI
jgi:hypothetical protein